MSLLYKHARFPDNPEVAQKIAAATASLHEKLAQLDLNRLDISEYSKKYLRSYQRKLRSNLQKFAYILAWGLAQNRKPLDRTVLLDYGGGSGILSLLAKECRIGTVIYNDIYDVACVDAETIGHVTGNVADHYVCGDGSDLAEFLKRTFLSCDVMISSDVIEHVYSIEGFFSKLPFLSTEQLSIAMSTHANPHNPILRRLLTRKQVLVEYADREYSPGHKKRDSLRSYLSIRKDIVRECSDDSLSDDEIEKLATVTRGMIDADIRSAVSTFLQTKELPMPIAHPTNTCDPYTGNWMDRFMDPSELIGGLSKAGFDVAVLAGRYGRPNGFIRQTLARILDFLITVFPNQSLRLAPFFLIHGSGDMSLRRQPEVEHVKEPSRASKPSSVHTW